MSMVTGTARLRHAAGLGHRRAAAAGQDEECDAPGYLRTHYWWAYVHPRAVRLFERQWLVNAILWGNYAKLRDAALAALAEFSAGSTLQVACAYGDLSVHLSAAAASSGGQLAIVDVLPIQLRNVQAKLPSGAPVRLWTMDAADLKIPAASFDQALVFFLLHEQPGGYRERTLHELCRVVRPGGRIVIVDYALPHRWHPLRYLWRPLLAALEPFALDLWRHEIARWLPGEALRGVSRTTLFGGLYQVLVIDR